jgi:hypothetical protein
MILASDTAGLFSSHAITIFQKIFKATTAAKFYKTGTGSFSEKFSGCMARRQKHF